MGREYGDNQLQSMQYRRQNKPITKNATSTPPTLASLLPLQVSQPRRRSVKSPGSHKNTSYFKLKYLTKITEENKDAWVKNSIVQENMGLPKYVVKIKHIAQIKSSENSRKRSPKTRGADEDTRSNNKILRQKAENENDLSERRKAISVEIKI